MKKTLVVADDITGSDDIGVMYYKSGHRAAIYPFHSREKAAFHSFSKLIVDTDSRYVHPQEAYNRKRQVVEKLDDGTLDLVFSKQCSVFRGNVGAEFDGVLDALGLDFAPVIAAFPDNGRTTVNGLHYVYGTLLEESQFRNDPVNPMHESSLEKIVGATTRRRVSSVYYTEYEKGLDYMKSLLEEKRKEGGYLVFDARDNKDLAFVAKLLQDEKVICGSSAIAYYLGLLEEEKDVVEVSSGKRSEKVLCLAGSLTKETAAQMTYLQEKGCPMVFLDTEEVCIGDKEKEAARILKEAEDAYRKSDVFVIRTPNGPGAIEKTLSQTGLDRREAAVRISTALSEIAHEATERMGIRSVVVCGGDTSDAFCRIYGIEGIEVGKEIESGVSVCSKLEDPSFRFVLKSGSFGSPLFVEKAIKALED